MSASKKCIYPDLGDILFSIGKYELNFKDITKFQKDLESNVLDSGKKDLGVRSTEILKDMHRHGFERVCRINYFKNGSSVSQKISFPTDANFEKKNELTFSKLKFEKKYYLDEKVRNQVANINIFLILHILYTRSIKSPVYKVPDLSDAEFKNELESLLTKNKIKKEYLGYFTHRKLLPKYRKLAHKLNLATLVFDQSMLLGANLMEIYELHARLIGETMDNFMTKFFPQRVDSLTRKKMNFNISQDGTLSSVEMQITNTFFFLANSKLIKDKRGNPLENYQDYFLPSNMEGLIVMYDLVQYKLDIITKVKIGMGNCPLSFNFLLRPEFEDSKYHKYGCRIRKYEITKPKVLAGRRKTKKNKVLVKKTKKKNKVKKSKKL